MTRGLAFLGLCVAFGATVSAVAFARVGWFYPTLGITALTVVAYRRLL